MPPSRPRRRRRTSRLIPKPPDLVGAQLAPFAAFELPIADWTDTGARKRLDGMPHGLEHPSHLTVAPLADRQPDDRRFRTAP